MQGWLEKWFRRRKWLGKPSPPAACSILSLTIISTAFAADPQPLAVPATLVGKAALASETPRPDGAEAARRTWHPGRSTTTPIGRSIVDPVRTPSTDGVYGRLEGDITYASAIGVGLPLSALEEPRVALRASAHYFWTFGIYGTYSNALRTDAVLESHPRSSHALGVELRPLFAPRWILNLEQGPPHLDLILDSLSVGFGTYWTHGFRKPAEGAHGAELNLGAGIPLFRRANGPWLELRGRKRWATSGPSQMLLLQLSWHGLWTSPWI